jgi:catechol 2,3-dioxygenase-like lactoylglutathione lyase family enzyme
MEIYRGRLIDHVGVRVSNLEASRKFYRAVLQAIGREINHESDKHFSSDELWFEQSDPVSSVHLAFQANDRETVQAFHRVGLASGGRDNGAPGERDYHPGYYAAFVIDPDGNNIEAVYHGEAKRSAAAVRITF